MKMDQRQQQRGNPADAVSGPLKREKTTTRVINVDDEKDVSILFIVL
jgi:hypothetical protein